MFTFYSEDSMCSSEPATDALVALGLPLALRSGLAAVDKVLQDDLQYGEVSEIVGTSGTGKTQVSSQCHYSC